MDIPEALANCRIYLILMDDHDNVLSANPPNKPAGLVAYMTPQIAMEIGHAIHAKGVLGLRMSEAIRMATDHQLALYLLDREKQKFLDLTGRDFQFQPEPAAIMPAEITALIQALSGPHRMG